MMLRVVAICGLTIGMLIKFTSVALGDDVGLDLIVNAAKHGGDREICSGNSPAPSRLPRALRRLWKLSDRLRTFVQPFAR